MCLKKLCSMFIYIFMMNISNSILFIRIEKCLKTFSSDIDIKKIGF